MLDLRYGNYQQVLHNVRADLILTSPPYNIGSKAKRDDGHRKLGKYDPKSFGAIREYPDNMPETAYQQEQVKFLGWAADHLTDDGILVYNHKPRRKNGELISPWEWLLKAKERGLRPMEEIVWDRGSTHNHCPQMMWAQTERLYVFAKGKYNLVNKSSNFLPQRQDVWRIPRAKANGHNAPFPVELAIAAIAAWCPTGGIVCDPYSGSGTAAIAARICGRSFVGAERLKKYHTAAMQRINKEFCSAA